MIIQNLIITEIFRLFQIFVSTAFVKLLVKKRVSKTSSLTTKLNTISNVDFSWTLEMGFFIAIKL
jgi:hypothetical protein